LFDSSKNSSRLPELPKAAEVDVGPVGAVPPQNIRDSMWEEFKTYLQGRHRTLEAIEEFNPNLTAQSRASHPESGPRINHMFGNRVTVSPQSC